MLSDCPAEFVPHKDGMCLLNRIVDAGDQWLKAQVDISPESLFSTAQGIPSYVGLEYLAQAVAAWAGYQERLNGGKPKIGFLVGTRRYRVSEPIFTFGDQLQIHVQQELVAQNGLQVFGCELYGNTVKGSAHINVFQPDDINAFLEETRHV